jgi:hypothetical protein
MERDSMKMLKEIVSKKMWNKKKGEMYYIKDVITINNYMSTNHKFNISQFIMEIVKILFIHYSYILHIDILR